ncbi:uncharacterized protein KY384_003767 [Bacidia gigantensis]|uniref:uncharacterized protein n=1 Tax=Bacidia gigantensis TaxID=2732470 RepID=UPI001D059170|nr:uncharacterized protein KY384_003767 [Bacidia gigantensis]KAG8532128.1 hypothetical protein KY384_003767 [Bacidia gigantensis]
MVGALNKLPIAVSGLVFFDAPVSVPSVSAIFVGFVSGIVYALAKVKQQTQAKTGSLPTSNASSQLPQSQQSTLPFIQGFLLGQLSIVVFIGAFIKFFVFGEIPSQDSKASSRQLARQQTQHHVRSNSLISASPRSVKTQRSGSSVHRSLPRLSAATILSKTYYNVDSHQPESLDWFNVLIAQTIAQFRDDANEDNAILTSLTSILNGQQKPDFLSEIKVTEISLGDEFPILSNCRVHPVDHGEQSEDARLQARMDVDLSDFITLGVDTKLILNYPRPTTAVLPVALAVSVLRFSGTLSVSFSPSSTTPSPSSTSSQPQPSTQTPTSLAFSFLPDYRLDLSVRSLVGSRSRLQDIPKISQLVESRLHQWIDERCVEPRVQHVVLPSFWPRKKNMRGPGSDGGAELGSEVKKGTMVDGNGDAGGMESKDFAEGRNGQEGQIESERSKFEEGLRLRRKEYEMPGSMPGMMVN